MPQRSLIVLTTLAALLGAVPSQAQSTIECRSRHYEYNECSARGLWRPQLIRQLSSSACIINRTWGYNPRSGYIWVADGCAGTFADIGGYHHGRGDTYDDGARHYDEHGRDAGAVIGGVVLGAILADAARSHHHGERPRYDGCHGDGCRVDPPVDGERR